MSGLLAVLLVIIPVFSSVGSITVLAAGTEDQKAKKAGIAYTYKAGEDIRIGVLAQNDSFASGEDVKLKVYVLNNTGETLTGGTLRFTGKEIADGRFTEDTADSGERVPGYGVKEESTAEYGASSQDGEPAEGARIEEAESDPGALETETESLEEDFEEQGQDPEEDDGDDTLHVTSDGRRIVNIELEPGEIFETEFFGTVDAETEEAGNGKVRFSFQAQREDKSRVSGTKDFVYNTGIATMLPVEMDNGGELFTNEANTMYLRTVLNDGELASLFTGPSFGGNGDGTELLPGTDGEDDINKATDSNAAPVGTSSNAEQETEAVPGQTESESETAGLQETEGNETDAPDGSEDEETKEASETETGESRVPDGDMETDGDDGSDEAETDTQEQQDTAAESDSGDAKLKGEYDAGAGDALSDEDKDSESGSEGEETGEAVYTAAMLGDNGGWEITYPDAQDGGGSLSAETGGGDAAADRTEKTDGGGKAEDGTGSSGNGSGAQDAGTGSSGSSGTESAGSGSAGTESEGSGSTAGSSGSAGTESAGSGSTAGGSGSTGTESAGGGSTADSGGSAGTESAGSGNAAGGSGSTGTESTGGGNTGAGSAAGTGGGSIPTESGEAETEADSQTPGEFDISDISYEIVTYGARLKGVSVDRQTVESERAAIVTAVDFRVADKTAPGLYFGTAITSVRYNKRTYKTSTDFSFYVTGEGEIVLTGSIDGAEIEVRGPVESFPDGDELDVKVSEVPAEKEAMVAAALERKAQEEGITVDRMKAVDIKIIADGTEQELTGEVMVTFQQMKLERLDGMEDETDENAGEADERDTQPDKLAEETYAGETADENATVIPAAARRAVSRRMRSAGDDGAAGGETLTVDDGESKKGGTADQETGRNLAVWHLDEEAGELNDMDSDVDENGNVVMRTNHFSIYLVVNVPDVSEVNVTVEHWAEIDDWQADDNMPTTYSSEKRELKYKETTVLGPKYLYPGKANPDTGEYDKKEVKIYSDDNVVLPNGAGTGLDYAVAVKDWSKVSLGGNYNVKSVTVYNEKYPEPEGMTFEEDDTEKVIYLCKENRIKINYEQNTGVMKTDTAFHDYNVTIQAENSKNLRTNYVGMNNLRLADGKYDADAPEQSTTIKRIGVGMKSTASSPQIDYEFSGDANVNGVRTGIPNIHLDSDRNIQLNGYLDPGLFTAGDILTNETYYNRVSQTTVTLGKTEGYNKESDCYIAKKYLPDYKLQFDRKGDTYILSKVLKPDGSAAVENLDVLEAKTVKWGGEQFLYSNMFWPLDDAEYGRKTNSGLNLEANGGTGYTNRDPLFGGNFGFGTNDEQLNFGNGRQIKHNWYFGMRYDYEFSLGDYIGPMNYYFRGDDDFWLYINDELVIDLGGIHGADGKYVDLTKWMFNREMIAIDWGDGLVHGSGMWRDDGVIKEIVPIDENKNPQPDQKFCMTVFFIERGGTGSCCYMNFTLPNAQPLPVKGSHTKYVEVEKKWVDADNRYLKRPATIFVQLKQDGENYGNPVALDAEHGWRYRWENLPVYKNVLSNEGEYEYTVEEIAVPPGYVEADVVWEGSKAVITNILKSRIQIAKQIDNWDEPSIDAGGNDLLDDEFIVKAVRTDGPEFTTGLVLMHAGTERDGYDESKFSGYIDLIPQIGEDGKTADVRMEIDEVVPKEYYKSETFLTVLSPEANNSPDAGTSVKSGVTINGNVVTLEPGAQAVILVHNTFEHKDYFHSDYSVGNEFRGSKHKLPLGLPVSGESQTITAAVPEKPDDEDDLDEDARLL